MKAHLWKHEWTKIVQPFIGKEERFPLNTILEKIQDPITHLDLKSLGCILLYIVSLHALSSTSISGLFIIVSSSKLQSMNIPPESPKQLVFDIHNS